MYRLTSIETETICSFYHFCFSRPILSSNIILGVSEQSYVHSLGTYVL